MKINNRIVKGIYPWILLINRVFKKTECSRKQGVQENLMFKKTDYSNKKREKQILSEFFKFFDIQKLFFSDNHGSPQKSSLSNLYQFFWVGIQIQPSVRYIKRGSGHHYSLMLFGYPCIYIYKLNHSKYFWTPCDL